MIYKESQMIESITNKNIKNFNKNGGIDMYIHEDDNEKEVLLKKMKEIDQKYEMQEYDMPEIQSLGLKEMVYESPSEENIEQQAKDYLQTYKEKELSGIKDKYSSKFENIDNDAIKALEDKIEDEEKIYSIYENILNKSKNINTKKGLSRSSIFENAIKEIEGEKEISLSEAELEYNKTISKLENERNILEQQKESALTSFDISYATKLQNKIANINSEIAKETAKVMKHNQDIAKQEEIYKKEQEKIIEKEQKNVDKKNQDLQNLIDKKGKTEIEKMKAQEKYEILYDYLSNVDKINALNELEQDSRNYKNALGSYYNLLYAQMLKRQE